MSSARLQLQTSAGIQSIGAGGALIGRAQECDVRLDSPLISRQHARIVHDALGWWIEDRGSTNGTRVDDRRIAGRAPLCARTVIEIGEETLLVLAIHGPALSTSPRSASPGFAPDFAGRGVGSSRTQGQTRSRARARKSPRATGSARAQGKRSEVGLSDATIVQRVPLAGELLRIGRAGSNDVTVPDQNVSRLHAEVRRHDTAYELRDLGSRNGTRLNGELVRRATVTVGDEIGVGAYRILLTPVGPRREMAPGRLVAHGVQQHVDRGRCVLQSTDLSLTPGEFVALIGESGSGKSTLMRILAGVTPPSGGKVTIDGEELAPRLQEIRYVAQADTDVLHEDLTAREALTYGTRLRLPPDTPTAEIAGEVERVLGALDMLQHAGTGIARLSGGQRRRVSVGMELVGSPHVLFLDEPGSSLDLLSQSELTDLLRGIAHGGCAVVAITHSAAVLEEYDRLLVMSRHGVLRFDGTPSRALAHFDVADLAQQQSVAALKEIHRRLARLSPPAPARERPFPAYAASRAWSLLANAMLGTRAAAVALTRTRASFDVQLRALAGRTARIVSRDRRYLALALIQAPLLAAVAAVVCGTTAFAPVRDKAGQSAKLLFALVLVATLAGAFGGVRALIGERAIFVRERALGVRAAPYLASKLLVLGALGLAQTALLALVAFSIAPLHSGVGTYAVIVLLLALATQVALATGLLFSALAAKTEHALGMLFVLLLLQVFCAGAIVAVREMGSLEPLPSLVSARWALAGVGSTLELSAARSAGDRGFGHFYGSFFELPWVESAAILLAFLAVLVGLTVWRLSAAWRR